MRKKIFPYFFFYVASAWGQLCTGSPHPHSSCAGWEALSQLDSIMPERIWEQEFSIFIDQEAFERKLPQWISQEHPYNAHVAGCVIGESHRYFLKATLSGANTRLLDLYEEFQWSPFWNYPFRLEELDALEENVKKENAKP